jgi:putative holliday junction resolvase
MTGRILAVDPGEKRIGIALSDETGCLARGLAVINHVSLTADCVEIARLARENEAVSIVIGNPIGDEGEETSQSRHAKRVAEKISELTRLPVELWDEHGSTKEARAIRLNSGANRKNRGGHLDEVAAAVILQSWLDSKLENEEHHG